MNFLFDGPRPLAARTILLDREARIAVLASDNIEFRRQLPFILADLLLPDMKVVNAQIVPSDQPHRLPDPFGDVPRTPIPAVVIRRFARVWVRGNPAFADGLHLVHRRQPVWLSLHSGHHQHDGRVEDDPQRVLPPMQAIFYRHPPGAKHVVGLQQFGVIQVDIGQVEAWEVQRWWQDETRPAGDGYYNDAPS